MIDEMVSGECERQKMERADYRFSRRDVRAFTNWGNTQLKLHLSRLEELEYLLVHRGGRGQSFVYELIFERGASGDKPVLPGLIDVESLRYDGNRAGWNGEEPGASRLQAGRVPDASQDESEPTMAGLPNGFYRPSSLSTDTGARKSAAIVLAGAR
jgi:hypothetical protein